MPHLRRRTGLVRPREGQIVHEIRHGLSGLWDGSNELDGDQIAESGVELDVFQTTICHLTTWRCSEVLMRGDNLVSCLIHLPSIDVPFASIGSDEFAAQGGVEGVDPVGTVEISRACAESTLEFFVWKRRRRYVIGVWVHGGVHVEDAHLCWRRGAERLDWLWDVGPAISPREMVVGIGEEGEVSCLVICDRVVRKVIEVYSEGARFAAGAGSLGSGRGGGAHLASRYDGRG